MSVHTGVYWRTDPVLLVSPDGSGWEEFKPTIWSPPAQIGRAVTDPVREVLWESNWTGPALQAAMRPMQRFADEYEVEPPPVDPQFFENEQRSHVERAYRSLPRRSRELLGELTTGPVDRRQFEESLELYGRYLERGAMIDAIDANALAFSNRLSVKDRWHVELSRMMFDYSGPTPPRQNCRLVDGIKGKSADYAIIDDPLCPPDRWYSGGAGELVTPEFWGMDAHRSFYELPAAPPVAPLCKVCRLPKKPGCCDRSEKIGRASRGVLEPTTVPLVDPSLHAALRDCVQRVEQGEPHVARSSARVRRYHSVTEPFYD